jgi:hypothetical protein
MNGRVGQPLFATASLEKVQVQVQHDALPDQIVDDQVVRAPLKYVGPYPCLGVRFPHLSTASQRERNETGVTLDFVLDTGANTNTINAQVAQQLSLNATGYAAPGVGTAGPIEGDLPTYLLGDLQLEGLGEEIFMSKLTASALPIASPASAGLLSLAFFHAFEGGVDFAWGRKEEPPSLTFFSRRFVSATAGRQRVHIKRIPAIQLPTVEVMINGQLFPALLDTGSPVTVMNAKAAQKAGVATVEDPNPAKKSKNPFAAFAGRVQQANAASRGDVLSIFGAGGKQVNLLKSLDPVGLQMPTTEDTEDVVDFGAGTIFVGDLPGIMSLQGLDGATAPAVVLGTDVLRRKPHMLFRPVDNEVWF